MLHWGFLFIVSSLLFYMIFNFFLVLWFAFQMWSGLGALAAGLEGGVAWWAHAGGFAAGVAMVWWAKGAGWVRRK